MVSCYISELLSKKENVLSGLFLNAASMDGSNTIDDLEQDFIKTLKLDDEYEVSFIDNYTLTGDAGMDYETTQAVFVQMASGSIDFAISPLEYMQNYAYKDCYLDLRTILSEEQLKKYESYFLYIVGDYMKQHHARVNSGESNEIITFPDFKKPEDMKDPIPVFIDLSKCDIITDQYQSNKESLVFGVVASTENLDNAISFLDFIMKR